MKIRMPLNWIIRLPHMPSRNHSALSFFRHSKHAEASSMKPISINSIHFLR